jgi:hypothetical protein
MRRRQTFRPTINDERLETRCLLATSAQIAQCYQWANSLAYNPTLQRQAWATCQQLASQPTTSPPVTNPPPTNTPSGPTRQQQLDQISRDSINRAITWMNRVGPGRHGGWLIYYAYPPIYQSQTQYTPAARPYLVTTQTAGRVLSQMYNNRYQVLKVVQY